MYAESVPGHCAIKFTHCNTNLQRRWTKRLSTSYTQQSPVFELNATSAQRSLEFMQMESRFTIHALESRVVSSKAPVADSYPISPTTDNKRVNLVTCSLAVAMQHMQSRNDELVTQLDELRSDFARQMVALVSKREELERSALRNSNSANALQSRLDETSLLLSTALEECDGLRGLVSDLRGNVESLTAGLTQLQGECGSKEGEISNLESCLTVTREKLERVQAERECH